VLLSHAVKGGLKSRISRVPLLLSDGGFALGVSRTSSGGVASGLSRAGALLLGESSRSGLLGRAGARLRGLEEAMGGWRRPWQGGGGRTQGRRQPGKEGEKTKLVIP